MGDRLEGTRGAPGGSGRSGTLGRRPLAGFFPCRRPSSRGDPGVSSTRGPPHVRTGRGRSRGGSSPGDGPGQTVRHFFGEDDQQVLQGAGDPLVGHKTTGLHFVQPGRQENALSGQG